MEEPYDPNKAPICKECGEQMVFRRSKFGAFYGCVNYPNCEFTVSVE